MFLIKVYGIQNIFFTLNTFRVNKYRMYDKRFVIVKLTLRWNNDLDIKVLFKLISNDIDYFNIAC